MEQNCGKNVLIKSIDENLSRTSILEKISGQTFEEDKSLLVSRSSEEVSRETDFINIKNNVKVSELVTTSESTEDQFCRNCGLLRCSSCDLTERVSEQGNPNLDNGHFERSSIERAIENFPKLFVTPKILLCSFCEEKIDSVAMRKHYWIKHICRHCCGFFADITGHKKIFHSSCNKNTQTTILRKCSYCRNEYTFDFLPSHIRTKHVESQSKFLLSNLMKFISNFPSTKIRCFFCTVIIERSLFFKHLDLVHGCLICYGFFSKASAHVLEHRMHGGISLSLNKGFSTTKENVTAKKLLTTPQENSVVPSPPSISTTDASSQQKSKQRFEDNSVLSCSNIHIGLGGQLSKKKNISLKDYKCVVCVKHELNSKLFTKESLEAHIQDIHSCPFKQCERETFHNLKQKKQHLKLHQDVVKPFGQRSVHKSGRSKKIDKSFSQEDYPDSTAINSKIVSTSISRFASSGQTCQDCSHNKKCDNCVRRLRVFENKLQGPSFEGLLSITDAGAYPIDAETRVLADELDDSGSWDFTENCDDCEEGDDVRLSTSDFCKDYVESRSISENHKKSLIFNSSTRCKNRSSVIKRFDDSKLKIGIPIIYEFSLEETAKFICNEAIEKSAVGLGNLHYRAVLDGFEFILSSKIAWKNIVVESWICLSLKNDCPVSFTTVNDQSRHRIINGGSYKFGVQNHNHPLISTGRLTLPTSIILIRRLSIKKNKSTDKTSKKRKSRKKSW